MSGKGSLPAKAVMPITRCPEVLEVTQHVLGRPAAGRIPRLCGVRDAGRVVAQQVHERPLGLPAYVPTKWTGTE